MDLKPLYGRVLIERDEALETTKGGIVIPDSAKKLQARGKILACGEGRQSKDGKLHPLAVKVGDRVLFGKYSGTAVGDEKDPRVIMDESDILAVEIPDED